MNERSVQRFMEVVPFELVSRFLALINITAIDLVTVNINGELYTLDVIRSGDEEAFTLNGSSLAEDPAKKLYQAIIGLTADLDLPGKPPSGDPAIRIGYVLDPGPPGRIDVGLVPYDQDFYVADVAGAREFLISSRVVQRLPDAIELALSQVE